MLRIEDADEELTAEELGAAPETGLVVRALACSRMAGTLRLRPWASNLSLALVSGAGVDSRGSSRMLATEVALAFAFLRDLEELERLEEPLLEL